MQIQFCYRLTGVPEPSQKNHMSMTVCAVLQQCSMQPHADDLNCTLQLSTEHDQVPNVVVVASLMFEELCAGTPPLDTGH